jgi:hypothetical protein
MLNKANPNKKSFLKCRALLLVILAMFIFMLTAEYSMAQEAEQKNEEPAFSQVDPVVQFFRDKRKQIHQKSIEEDQPLGLLSYNGEDLWDDFDYSDYYPLEAPDWMIYLSSYGYADLLLDWTPGRTGREYLSGEWGAAVSYKLSGTTIKPIWLEPNFEFPDWKTNSNFHITTPFTELTSSNLAKAYSVIANDHLRIRQDYEIIDTVFGIPIGLTPASSSQSGRYMNSNRYVLKHTYTIRNMSGQNITDLELYQLLHGLQSQVGIYDNREYPGTYGDYFTIAQIGRDEWWDWWSDWDYDDQDWDNWDLEDPDTAYLEDFIVFASSRQPSSFENSYFGIETQDDHMDGKPSIGVHLSIENGSLNNQDYFAPELLWIGSAMSWNLGSLANQAEVSLTVYLSILTGNVVTFSEPSGSANGGAENVGGIDYTIHEPTKEGSIFVEYICADRDEIQQRVEAGQFGEPFFLNSPTDNLCAWNVFFSGEFTGSIELTFAYDPALEPLALYTWDGKTWKHLNCRIDSKSKTITATVNSLGWFALGYDGAAVPRVHPGVMMLLLDDE